MINIDDSRFPLVYIHYPPDHTFDEWKQHTADMTALLHRGRPFLLVSNTIGCKPPDAAERKLIAQSFEVYEDAWRKTCIGSVVVVNSQIVRGALTALQWLRPPPFPHTVVTTVDEAYAWAAKQIAKRAGVAASPPP